MMFRKQKEHFYNGCSIRDMVKGGYKTGGGTASEVLPLKKVCVCGGGGGGGVENG